MTTPTVTKYMGCSQFDSGTGECVAPVWVDPPMIVPELPLGFVLSMVTVIGLGWVAIAAHYPIQDAIRDN